MTPQERALLSDVITHHPKIDIKGCRCGWAELGKSHSDHVVAVYEQTLEDFCEWPQMHRAWGVL